MAREVETISVRMTPKEAQMLDKIALFLSEEGRTEQNTRSHAIRYMVYAFRNMIHKEIDQRRYGGRRRGRER